MQIAFIDGAINPFITGTALESQLRVKIAPAGICGAMGTRPRLCRRPITGYRKMSGTNRQPTAQRGARRPASLVDSQLEHLENMVQQVARGDAVSVLVPLDHEYWEKRIRALEETHELIASQRKRVIKLLDRLGSDAQMKLKQRTAA